MKYIERFVSMYHRDPAGTIMCPYRICPLGAHVDHQYGRITGLAIDKGVRIAYGPKKNGVVELSSLQFEKRAQWHISQVDEKPVGDWGDYLRGATWALAKYHTLHVGLCGVVEGTLPIGGLSSSAAVIIAFLSALANVNGIRLDRQEIIRIALEAERDYVGVAVGTLDQSCEVLSKKNHLLYLDTKDNSYELIPQHAAMKPYRIAILFSGIERSLAGSKFNMRVDEAKAAAYALMAYSGVEYGKFNEARLRDVPWAVFDRYKDRLPDNWRKRAEHFYTECDRVQKGVEAWRRGDLETYGRLSFESGYSSIYSWETGSDELRTLYEIMKRTDGIYGGRFSGAGFKGCCMALIDPAFAESIEKSVGEEYLKVFPQLEGKYSFHLCDSADGVTL
ncbi:MAG: GHMP kinase [Clostridia bacterium]|nr:GHMP kinase [Clostridia bacterium]